MSDVVRASEASTSGNDITAYVGTDQFTMAIFNKTISEMNTALSQRAELSGGKIPESYLPYKIICMVTLPVYQGLLMALF